MSTRLLLAATLCLATAACTEDHGTAPDTDMQMAVGGAVVASASGGADWVLEVFGFVIPQTLGFSATKLADGRVRGQINYHQTFLGQTFRFTANVTCLNVYDGNRAKYGGQIILSTDPDFPPGGYIWFQAIDNGEGAGSPPDQSTGSGFGTAAESEAFCNSSTPPNPLFLATVNGNIQVDGD